MAKFIPFPKGFNPRTLPSHKERGPKKYYYTNKDIAKLLGVTVDRVYHLKVKGVLNPSCLESIVELIIKRRIKTMNKAHQIIIHNANLDSNLRWKFDNKEVSKTKRNK